ncbi:MAG TPA: GNAT family N-acetyltransferase [Actinomycetales bacterium]|nr:GNAT family N-acetyltransferase [Actinomycetales bacterium]
MQLTWLDPDRLTDRDVAAAVALLEAARVVDYPHELGPTPTTFTADLQHGWDGDPAAVALATQDDGRVVGVLGVQLPRWDNTHMVYLEVTVDPELRRQGLGRQMFDAGVERGRADGRTLVVAGSFDHNAGPAFLKSVGLDRACDDVQRRQDLLTLDRAELDRRFGEVEGRARGYELVHLQGTTPDEMLDGVARMTEVINDAPLDDLALEDEVFTPARIRAFEAAQVAHRRRTYRIVARERGTGVLAGHTMVAVDADRPWFAEQYDTSVLRAHRGHRLGLVLKIEMLRWLRVTEPQLRTLDTWNAASNAHMVAVNEALGYRVIARASEWQRQLA